MDFIQHKPEEQGPTRFTKQEIPAKRGSSQYQVDYTSIQRHLPVIGIIPTLHNTQV